MVRISTCKCGFQAVGGRQAVVSEMQTHLATAHGRKVEAETILAKSVQLDQPTQNRSPHSAPALVEEGTSSRLMLRRLTEAIGRQTKHPIMASLATLLSEHLEPTSLQPRAESVRRETPKPVNARITDPSQNVSNRQKPTEANPRAAAPGQDNVEATRKAALSLARETAEEQAKVRMKTQERSLGLSGMEAGLNAMHQLRMGIGD